MAETIAQMPGTTYIRAARDSKIGASSRKEEMDLSYLSTPRIAFSGTFQADVSTVNNDVRHFDLKTFEPRFQQLQEGNRLNGWWNPDGTGAFRLQDVALTQAWHDDAPVDLGGTRWTLHGNDGRTAAKLVDLDPQFQMGSTIFGLQVQLRGGDEVLMTGNFRAAPFRDITFGRVAGLGGSGGASARFTSVLENVVWANELAGSPVLEALRTASHANGDRLSMSLVTFGYDGGTTYGRVIGAIGAWRQGEPLSMVCKRRLAPPNGWFQPDTGVATADVELRGEYAYLDLGNCLPLADVRGGMKDMGELRMGVLRTPDVESGAGTANWSVQMGVAPGAVIEPGNAALLDAIPYTESGWLAKTAGGVTLRMSDEARQLSKDRPIAILRKTEAGKLQVLLRETAGGYHVRADAFIQRVDSAKNGAVTVRPEIYVSQYGAPRSGVPVACDLLAPEEGEGGGGGVDQPKAQIPTIGVPAKALDIPNRTTTDEQGISRPVIAVKDPKNPRRYVDGQIYKIGYGVPMKNASATALFDQIILHVRDAYDPPANPQWQTDVLPVLAQFGNLYPVMSRGLFSFTDPQVLAAHANLMIFALTRCFDDPNHMPVTRDLSEGKRKTIVGWLTEVAKSPSVLLQIAHAPASHAPASVESPPVPVESVAPPRDLPQGTVDLIMVLAGTGNDGKSHALRSLIPLHQRRTPT